MHIERVSREVGEDRTKLPKGFVEILEEECKGCGLCVDACPQGELALSDDINRKGHRYVQQPDIGRCTGCSLCYVQCPSSAIIVYRLTKPGKGKKRA